ncbi:unnamed protein product [Anisakis simplex]|uniref:MEL-46 (inferred by orthology to a C. elegans protein) n=1 Tax=Anisakis simplex TaxID=6269 RepID=A0A0M3K7F0_ANISI|nr:unnamed protein product [Anisakis simplex]
MVFQRCEHILNALQAADIDAELISGNMEQTERNRIMRRLKNFQLKILVSTDLTARGIDAENVNCVLNFGAPLSSETYLHRIGRAGRFGGYGIAITLLTCGKEVKRFMNLMETAHLKVKLLHLTQQYPRDLCNNQTFYDSSSFFKPAKKSAEEETTADNGTDVNSAKERSLLNDEIISMSQQEEVISKSALIYSARKLDCDPNELSEHGTLSDEMLQRVRNLEKIRQQKALKLNHEEEESHSYNDDPIESATSNGGSFLINTCPNSIKVEMESEKHGFVNGETILKNAMKSLKIDSEETTEATHSSLMVSSDYSRNDHCSPGQQSSAAINPILSVVSSSTEAQESAAVRQQLADDGLSGSLLNRPKSRFKRLTSSRAKQRQIITYLRGELLKIRNARTDSEWWNYVSAKYASSIPREIFVGNNQQVVSVVHATPSTSFTESSSSLLVQFEKNREKVSRPISTTPSERTVYRRDEMLKIRKSRCAQEWSLWATQKWNTKEEPFQMDRELRVPFAERLRISREREKKTRNALRAKEEHKKVKRTDLLYSSARYPVCVEMPTTFDEYVVDFYKCVNEFEQKEVQNKRTGPVVRPLRKPQQYNEAVHNASVYLKNLKSSFWSEWNLKMDNIRDQSTSTEEDLLLGSRRDTVVQTDGEFVETTAKQNADVSHPVPGVCDKMDKGSVDHAENNFFTTSETDQNVECTKEQCDDEHLKLINCYYYYMNYYTERYFNQRKKTD